MENGSAKEKPSTLKDQKCSKHMKNLLCDESQSLTEAKQTNDRKEIKQSHLKYLFLALYSCLFPQSLSANWNCSSPHLEDGNSKNAPTV